MKKALLIACLAIAMFLLVAFLGFTKAPGVAGLDRSVAAKLLKDASLDANYSYEYSGRSVGTVLDQKPAAQSILRRGGSVSLVISKGLPSVVGLNIKKARNVIGQIEGTRPGLKIAKGQYNDRVNEGLILSQSPSANSSVSAGSMVQVVVSKGRPVVPDLSGTTREEAQGMVRAARLVFKVRREHSARVSQAKVDSEIRRIGADVAVRQMRDWVESQKPAAGTRVAIGTRVEVVIYNEEQVILASPNQATPMVVVRP